MMQGRGDNCLVLMNRSLQDHFAMKLLSKSVRFHSDSDLTST